MKLYRWKKQDPCVPGTAWLPDGCRPTYPIFPVNGIIPNVERWASQPDGYVDNPEIFETRPGGYCVNLVDQYFSIEEAILLPDYLGCLIFHPLTVKEARDEIADWH